MMLGLPSFYVSQIAPSFHFVFPKVISPYAPLSFRNEIVFIYHDIYWDNFSGNSVKCNMKVFCVFILFWQGDPYPISDQFSHFAPPEITRKPKGSGVFGGY